MMNPVSIVIRRAPTLALMLIGVLTLEGCSTSSVQPINAAGVYCHRMGKSQKPKLTCTPVAVPSDAAEVEAKRFDVDPLAMTVFVLRQNWGDASLVVPVRVNNADSAATVPESLVRLRLKPGAHRLTAQWEGQSLDLTVEGQAGTVQVVRLVGRGWSWGTSFSWEAEDVDRVQSQAKKAKLVADLDLR